MTPATDGPVKPGEAMRADDPEARREAARLLGGARTPRKAETARKNIEGVRKPFKNLADIPCNCGGGDSLDHRSTCPRGRTIRRRLKLGQPV